MLQVGGIHHRLALREDRLRATLMHGGRGQPRDPFVLVFVVVVVKEGTTPCGGRSKSVKPVGKGGRILGGLEERFRIRVTAADARPRERTRNAELLITAAIRIRDEWIADNAGGARMPCE